MIGRSSWAVFDGPLGLDPWAPVVNRNEFGLRVLVKIRRALPDGPVG